jgi:hypothetical protein
MARDADVARLREQFSAGAMVNSIVDFYRLVAR